VRGVRSKMAVEPGFGVFGEESEAWIAAEDLTGDGLGFRIGVDADEGGGFVHAGEKPGGGDSGAGAEFEEAAGGLRGGEDLKEVAGAAFGAHGEAELDGESLNGGEFAWEREERGLVHVGIDYSQRGSPEQQ
jgi:hypothetical protein